MTEHAFVDGNEAAARVAYALSELAAIYPITPASAMGELADAWSAAGRPNLWGAVPRVVEMQSEAGAAAVLHGAVSEGILATTFTASQGLLLMLPNMFKIAGEHAPAVIHVAARTLATHALSIFGDHSDVMAARTTGWAMLSSSGVQEAHDLAAVSHAATLATRIPFLHFFDGFRTSHEIGRVALLSEADLAALIDDDALRAHRGRALTPDRPSLRGSAQNPDVFFQAREASNPLYAAVPTAVQAAMDTLAARTGRSYHLVDYRGHPRAERIVVLMGSGAGAAAEAVDRLVAEGQKVGMVVVRLFRPFPVGELAAVLPGTTRAVAVLDRTKEPGASGEPLYSDVVSALAEGRPGHHMAVVGGRYGLASKEFTPAMVAAVFDSLDGLPRNHFTVGIVDDVSGTSLPVDAGFDTDTAGLRAVFYGLGSDGTVGANKATVKIVGEQGAMWAQGYFSYDSKKSGSMTVSHLRFADAPIRSSYLIAHPDFVACHQFGLLQRADVLAGARPGATFLQNSPWGPEGTWSRLPARVQRQIRDRGIRLFAVDAHRVAREAGIAGRINTIMQACFFALTDLVPFDAALDAMRRTVTTSYAKRGPAVVEANLRALDSAAAGLVELPVPDVVDGVADRPVLAGRAPDFVERVTARMIASEGDSLPVSAFPAGGEFPTATARYEKRGLADNLPVWEPEGCIDCGKCTIVCPHAAIRMKLFDPGADAGAPAGFASRDFRSRDLPGKRLAIAVSPEDCTSCGLCVAACPAKSKIDPARTTLWMSDHPDREAMGDTWRFFETLPAIPLEALGADSVKGSQVREPLFEFSGACSGCGETPYLKLLTQLMGDRMVVANATGCSSIYGGNLPTTPWSVDAAGRGPAWANSLFEDNAEFGMGLRVGLDTRRDEGRRLLRQLADRLPADVVETLLAGGPAAVNDGAPAGRAAVAALQEALRGLQDPAALRLAALADDLVERVVWIVGGDGWAYDIGFGGLDHVLGSGEDVNVLVLDTEVYSNTGGQASKATPRGAVAKFAAAGKPSRKKDLGAMARVYGDVYVAQICLQANETQAVKALTEAVAHHGPSLVVAYAPCIEHHIDIGDSLDHARMAVGSGYWPLWRYRPEPPAGEARLRLDSKRPALPVAEFMSSEGRFAQLARSQPERAARLAAASQSDVDERWATLAALAAVPAG